MEKRFYLGVDIGSSETKGLILDERYRIVARHSVHHVMENPRPGFFEHDAETVWWHDFCVVTRELLHIAGLNGRKIACVGASTLGCCCLPVDQHCRPLRKAILYGIDSRAGAEIAWLTDYYGEDRVRELFGRPIVSGDVAPKILWIKNHEPEVYAKTHKFLAGSSFLTARLTGRYLLDQFLGQAGFRPLYRRDGAVNAELCTLYCRPDQLAETQYAHQIAGTVSAGAAAQTGLAEGTPVLTGTGDSTAEAISCGVLKPGEMMLQFGSTLFLYYCSDHLIEDDRVRGNNFVIPGTWSVAGGTNAAGTLTRWYRDQLYPDLLAGEAAGGPNTYDAMLDGLASIPPGSDGLLTLPYLAGERTPINDPRAKGVIFGLKLSHSRAHLYRSALEAVAYSVAQHVRVLRDHKLPLDKIIAVGGGTKSPVWMQMVADVLGLPVHIPEITVGASYGDALMAAIGCGAVKDFAALEEIIRVGAIHRPDGAAHKAYQEYLKLYDDLYVATRDLMHRLDPGPGRCDG